MLIVVWIIIILVVFLPLLGKIIIGSSFSKSANCSKQYSEIVLQQPELEYKPAIFVARNPNDSRINQAMQDALDSAHKRAEIFAAERLDAWVDVLMTRVDNNFLNWYFSWFNMNWREDGAIIRKLIGQDVAKQLGQDFQSEF